MSKPSFTNYLLAVTLLIQQGCSLKEKHPVILGNINLNKEINFQDPSFFEHFSETFYIEEQDRRASGNTSKICDVVIADPRFQVKDSTLHGRKVSSKCFQNFSRAYLFGGFRNIEEYEYYDSSFNQVKVRKLLGGIFHPFKIENILTGVQLDLCTFIPTYCQCPEIMISTDFSAQVKNYFEQQMFEKYGEPDAVDINSRTLRTQLDKIKLPIRLIDTSYWDIQKKGDEPMDIIIYEWKKNGYVVRLVIKRTGPIFSNAITDPAFSKFESEIEGSSNSYLLNLLKQKPASATFRLDFINRSVISYDSYSGFIRYELDEETQKELSNKLKEEKRKKERMLKENREVF